MAVSKDEILDGPPFVSAPFIHNRSELWLTDDDDLHRHDLATISQLSPGDRTGYIINCSRGTLCRNI